MRLTKAMLRVGKYHSPDGVLDVTADRLKHWAEQFGLMKSRSLGIPVGVDHSDNLAQTVPVAFSTTKSKKRSAINGVGWLDSFQVSADGQSAELTVDIGDEKAADKAAKNLVELSPIIYPNWRDGQGNDYRDVITHVDLVHHPVDASQTEFKQVPDETAIACCLRMSADVGCESPTLFRMAFGDDEDGGDSESSSDEGESTAPEATKTEDAENPDLPKEPAADKLQLDALVAILSDLGYALPADTSAETIVRDLLTVFKNAKAMEDKADQDKAKEEAENADTSQINEAQPSFAAMSLEARTALGYAEQLHREKLESRLSGLLASGRCTPAEAEAKTAAMGAIKLSLGSDGTPARSSLEDWLADRESLPKGAAWDPDTKLLRLGLDEAQPEIDTDLQDGFSDEKAEQLVDKLFRKPKKSA